MPESAMCAPVKNRGMIFTDDLGKEYRFEQEGVNVWRSHFDGWLAQEATESGAKVRDGVAVLTCTEKEDFVQVSLHGESNDTESARYILDCEGVVGVLKRQITGEIPGFLNPVGEGISAAMESGYCAACAVMRYFDDPLMACESYRQSTEKLKSYMQRQWSLVGRMAGTFRQME